MRSRASFLSFLVVSLILVTHVKSQRNNRLRWTEEGGGGDRQYLAEREVVLTNTGEIKPNQVLRFGNIWQQHFYEAEGDLVVGSEMLLFSAQPQTSSREYRVEVVKTDLEYTPMFSLPSREPPAYALCPSTQRIGTLRLFLNNSAKLSSVDSEIAAVVTWPNGPAGHLNLTLIGSNKRVDNTISLLFPAPGAKEVTLHCYHMTLVIQIKTESNVQFMKLDLTNDTVPQPLDSSLPIKKEDVYTWREIPILSPHDRLRVRQDLGKRLYDYRLEFVSVRRTNDEYVVQGDVYFSNMTLEKNIWTSRFSTPIGGENDGKLMYHRGIEKYVFSYVEGLHTHVHAISPSQGSHGKISIPHKLNVLAASAMSNDKFYMLGKDILIGLTFTDESNITWTAEKNECDATSVIVTSSLSKSDLLYLQCFSNEGANPRWQARSSNSTITFYNQFDSDVNCGQMVLRKDFYAWCLTSTSTALLTPRKSSSSIQ